MECPSCGRIWHVGEPRCPTCQTPAIERTIPESARESGEPSGPGRFSRRDFIIGAIAGGAAATVAVLLPVTLTGGDGDGDSGSALLEPTPSDGGPSVVVLTTYPRQRIASLSGIKVGEPVDFEYPLAGQHSFLIKLGDAAAGGLGTDGDVVAFSYLCTHMGCPLVGLYRDDHKVLGPCGCHYSTFDLRRNGMVVLGQATQNLPQVTLDIDGDDIYATGIMGLIYGYSDNLVGAAPAEVTG